jgi:hypothetical protein
LNTTFRNKGTKHNLTISPANPFKWIK